MRRTSRIVCFLALSVLLPSLAANPDCRCIDPPSDMPVTINTTLTTVDIGRDYYDDLEDTFDDGELVFIIETVPLGSCSHCAQTFIKYLPGFDIDSFSDADHGLCIPINEVIYSITECWPPSRVAFTATLFEDDYDSDSDIHDILRNLVRTTAEGQPIPALSSDAVSAGWSYRLSGAWLSRLNQAIAGGKDVIGRVTTWRRSFPTDDGTSYRGLPDEVEITLVYGRTNTTQGYIYWQLHHDYDYPPGSCTGESGEAEGAPASNMESSERSD